MRNHVCLVVTICVFLFGCAHESKPTEVILSKPAIPIADRPAQDSSIGLRRVHTGDIVILHVTPGKEFEKDLELTVNSEGEILVPLVGWVKIEGMTTRDSQEAIRKKLDKDFLVNPNVSVRIKEANSRAVVLLGQLKKPGTYEFPQNGKMTLLEAIAKAEGFTDIANLREIKLVRTLPDGKQITMRVNAEKILGGQETDITLEEGDLVTVPESLF